MGSELHIGKLILVSQSELVGLAKSVVQYLERTRESQVLNYVDLLHENLRRSGVLRLEFSMIYIIKNVVEK